MAQPLTCKLKAALSGWDDQSDTPLPVCRRNSPVACRFHQIRRGTYYLRLRCRRYTVPVRSNKARSTHKQSSLKAVSPRSVRSSLLSGASGLLVSIGNCPSFSHPNREVQNLKLAVCSFSSKALDRKSASPAIIIRCSLSWICYYKYQLCGEDPTER